MKRRKQRQVFLAWLLLLCMLPLSVTKITHRHGQQQTACCAQHQDCQEENESHDDPCNCLICKFTLSPFLSAENASFIPLTTLLSYEPAGELQPLQLEPVRHFSLRAPPAV